MNHKQRAILKEIGKDMQTAGAYTDALADVGLYHSPAWHAAKAKEDQKRKIFFSACLLVSNEEVRFGKDKYIPSVALKVSLGSVGREVRKAARAKALEVKAQNGAS